MGGHGQRRHPERIRPRERHPPALIDVRSGQPPAEGYVAGLLPPEARTAAPIRSGPSENLRYDLAKLRLVTVFCLPS